MWKIEQVLTRCSSHQTCWVRRQGPSLIGQQSNRYWGKQFIGSPELPEFQYFERQAAFSSLAHSAGFLPLVDARLDGPQPLIVYADQSMISLQQWIHNLSQAPATAMLVWMFRQAVESIAVLHRAGLAHGQVNSQHVAVTENLSVRVIGLGALEPIGATTCLPRLTNRFDAPECSAGEFEVSSAADVYSLGILWLDVMGSSFRSSPFVTAMLAADPNDRPSTPELVTILRELEMHLFGGSIQPVTQPSRTEIAA